MFGRANGCAPGAARTMRAFAPAPIVTEPARRTASAAVRRGSRLSPRRTARLDDRSTIQVTARKSRCVILGDRGRHLLARTPADPDAGKLDGLRDGSMTGARVRRGGRDRGRITERAPRHGLRSYVRFLRGRSTFRALSASGFVSGSRLQTHFRCLRRCATGPRRDHRQTASENGKTSSGRLALAKPRAR